MAKKQIQLYDVEATRPDGSIMRTIDGLFLDWQADNFIEVKKVEAQHPPSQFNIWSGTTNHRKVKSIKIRA